MDSNRDLAARAFHGRGVFVARDRLSKLATVARCYGFTTTSPKDSLTERVHDLGEDMLVHALMWAFHSGGIHKRGRGLQRMHFWISREELLRRYLTSKGRPHRTSGSLDRIAGISAAWVEDWRHTS